PYAGRLIKSGCGNATIRIDTDRSSYITELRRRDDGTVELRRTTGGPIEGEGWLAVGFPPLRTVTWERRGDMPMVRARPRASDVLPIVVGAPDPRLDRLKSWVVDIYFRRLEEESLQGPPRYARLLEAFFQVIREVAPGISVRFSKVNVETKEVLLETD